jgi:hypothetical protein
MDRWFIEKWTVARVQLQRAVEFVSLERCQQLCGFFSASIFGEIKREWSRKLIF